MGSRAQSKGCQDAAPLLLFLCGRGSDTEKCFGVAGLMRNCYGVGIHHMHGGPIRACTQWCKFMSKNLNFAGEISRGGRGRTRVGGAIKKREISLTS